jgi:hypothetical protein
MPGRARAPESGAALEAVVADLAQQLGMEVRRKVKVGRRLWGSVRNIDVVVTEPRTRKTIGIECKYQGGQGTAEEKLPSLISDIQAWPIPGILVFDGPGFSANMKAYLYSTGKAVALHDLQDWLSLFFGL